MYNNVIFYADQKKWKGFLLRDYFYFVKGNQNNMSILLEGNMPLVSAKNTNNGYKNFVLKNNKKVFSGHCLTINNDGDGGAGISYYQPVDFLLDSHVTALIPKIEMTEKILLSISGCITIQREQFGHGYSINNGRLNIFQIKLPINDKNEPDWEYMEKCVQKKIHC